MVLGTLRQFLGAHPKRADLIVEVSGTTLRCDHRRKGSLYARAGVADYWIVNLVDRQVEVYRDPVPDPGEALRLSLRLADRPRAAGEVSPLALPGQGIAVAHLLP